MFGTDVLTGLEPGQGAKIKPIGLRATTIGVVAKANVIRAISWTEAVSFLYSIGKLAPCAPGLHSAL